MEDNKCFLAECNEEIKQDAWIEFANNNSRFRAALCSAHHQMLQSSNHLNNVSISKDIVSSSKKQMTCMICGLKKAWPDAFPDIIYAECWKCNWEAHNRQHHPPKRAFRLRSPFYRKEIPGK